MKIAFIGGFDRLYDEEGKARSFEKLGCEVLRIDLRTFTEASLQKIKDWSPDLIMSPKYEITPEHLQAELFAYAKRNGVKTAAWHPDLYHFPGIVAGRNRFATITNKMGLWACDYVFTPDGASDSDVLYERCGINHHLIRQAPYDETVGLNDSVDVSDLTDKKEIPILFVGSMYDSTDQFRRYLLGFVNEVYGDKFLWLGTSEHQVREERLSSVIARSKIVLGDSVYFPGYWSNRIYESIGRGGFVIHPFVPGIEKEFEDGKECVFYNRWNFDDLKSKIDYYLENDKERSMISKKGMERIQKEHTLLHRCKEILEIING